jgi:hypothetical protein
MRKGISLFSVLLFMALPLMAGQTKKVNLQDSAAGRIRFVQGEGATCTFDNKTFSPLMDYLVLLGATFETNNSRLELVTLNKNLYWFDNGTDFYFESIDPKGYTTQIFLGKGSFVVKTKLPFTMISGAGSVYFPGNGRYMVMKNAFGKDKVFVTTLEGEKPVIVKKSTVFSRVKLKKQENRELTAWVTNREDNWRRTLTRASVFSNVDKMPPYVAFTGTDGKRHWKKVTDVKPIYRMNGMLSGNWLLLNRHYQDSLLMENGDVRGALISNNWTFFTPKVLRATGLWSPYADSMDDSQISLFFAASQWNSVRWAWSVPSGWYAEYYWDPLAGFGVKDRSAMMTDNAWSGYWIWLDDRRDLMRDAFYDQRNVNYRDYVSGLYSGYARGTMPVEHYPGLSSMGRERVRFRGNLTDKHLVYSHRWVKPNEANRIRTRVDRTLHTERQARDLNVSPSRIVRARQIVDLRRKRTRIWETRMGGNQSMAGSTSYVSTTPTSTSTSTMPSISTSSGTRGSGAFPGKVRIVPPGH